MDDFMFFGFASEIQSDELTQEGSDRDWEEYNNWLEEQEREWQDESDEVDPSGGYDESDDIYEERYERDYPSLYEQDNFWDE